MELKTLEKELDADIRNKLTYPKILLELLAKEDKRIKPEDIEKALKDMEDAARLTKKWFEEFRRGKTRE